MDENLRYDPLKWTLVIRIYFPVVLSVKMDNFRVCGRVVLSSSAARFSGFLVNDSLITLSDLYRNKGRKLIHWICQLEGAALEQQLSLTLGMFNYSVKGYFSWYT